MTRVQRLAAAMIFTGALLTGLPDASTGMDLGPMYDDATLQYWKNRYERNIRLNLNNVVLPSLSPAEQQGLAWVNYDFPLHGHYPEMKNNPYIYYATTQPPQVVIPILSLKFLDDLTVGYAWLLKNGYDPQTVLGYVTLLRCENSIHFNGGQYLPPLEALGVPATAIEDPDVDGMAQMLFKTAVVFILLHEMGHALYAHEPNTQEQSRINKWKADQFAIDVMRRIGAQPTGMVFYFTLMAFGAPNNADAAGDARQSVNDTHPMTADRLQAIAYQLRQSVDDFALEFDDPETGRDMTLDVADQIVDVADRVANPDFQSLIRETACHTTPAMLAPQRAGELPGAVPPSNGQ